MESVTPQVVFTLFGLPVRSTVLATWVAMGLIILVIVILDRTKPYLLENFAEFLSNLIGGIMNLEKRGKVSTRIGNADYLHRCSQFVGCHPAVDLAHQ